MTERSMERASSLRHKAPMQTRAVTTVTSTLDGESS